MTGLVPSEPFRHTVTLTASKRTGDGQSLIFRGILTVSKRSGSPARASLHTRGDWPLARRLGGEAA